MFTSREAVDEYLSGAKLECLECSKLFKGLAPHLLAAHRMSVADYKTKYGIPQTRGLSGSGAREGRSAAAKRRVQAGEITIAAARAKPPVCSGSVAKPPWHQDKFFSGGTESNTRRRTSENDAEEYLRRLAEGRSVKSVSADVDMPSGASIYKYASGKPEYSKRLRKVTKKNKSNTIKKLRAKEKELQRL